MRTQRYGIYARKFNSGKYKFIKGYRSYMGAAKAMKNTHLLRLEGRSEIKIIPYVSYMPIIYVLIVLAMLIIVARVI